MELPMHVHVWDDYLTEHQVVQALRRLLPLVAAAPEAGWLQPLSVDEYRAAVSTATSAEIAREPHQIAIPTVAPPLGPCTGAAAGVVLESLPVGFDARAEEAYLTLLRSAPTMMAQAAH